ncbi:MAG: hypothetical protein WC773_01670 [Patescibacteria group bacterium]|jgi:hypothetical protein
MSQLFYAHLVPLDEALHLLDQYELESDERDQLEEMVYAIFDHNIMNLIMQKVPKEHHDNLVEMIAVSPFDLAIIDYLKTHAPDIETDIMDVGKQVHYQLIPVLAKPANKDGGKK